MKKSLFVFSIFALLVLSSYNSFSQCAMCRRVAESGHSNDKSAASGLNKGILYLLAIPYVLGGVGAIVWFKNRKKD